LHKLYINNYEDIEISRWYYLYISLETAKSCTPSTPTPCILVGKAVY